MPIFTENRMILASIVLSQYTNFASVTAQRSAKEKTYPWKHYHVINVQVHKLSMHQCLHWRLAFNNHPYDVMRADDVEPEVIGLDACALFSQLRSCAILSPADSSRRRSVHVAERCATKSSTATCFPACLPSFLPGRIECLRLLQQRRPCRPSYTVEM